MWHKAAAATGFVHAGAADCDPLFGFKGALRIVGGLAAFHADGVGLRDVFRDGQKLGHWLPGLSRVVLIQTRHDYPHTEFREFVDDTDKLVVKKLRFVDPYNFGIRVDIRAHVGRGANVLGFVFHL